MQAKQRRSKQRQSLPATMFQFQDATMAHASSSPAITPPSTSLHSTLDHPARPKIECVNTRRPFSFLFFSLPYFPVHHADPDPNEQKRREMTPASVWILLSASGRTCKRRRNKTYQCRRSTAFFLLFGTAFVASRSMLLLPATFPSFSFYAIYTTAAGLG